MRKIIFSILLLLPFFSYAGQKAYVFSYFDGNQQGAGLRLAYSYDGYTWTAINDNRSILSPAVGPDKLMRDPSICQAPDGTFHMVWTTGWTDRIIGHAHSIDLIHWGEQQIIPVMEDHPSTRNSWAPELFYDQKSKRYFIFWASTVPGALDVQTEGCLSESDYNHRIYCCTTKDFKKFSKTKLYFNPSFNAIDAAVVRDPENGELIMAVKNENLNPPQKNIRITRSKSMKKGFPIEVSEPIHSVKGCEGPSPLFLENGDLLVFFDKYYEHRYGASLSHDHGRTWEDATDLIHMPEGMSHGTALCVDKAVVDQLVAWDKNRK